MADKGGLGMVSRIEAYWFKALKLESLRDEMLVVCL